MSKFQTADEIARSNRADIYLGVVAPIGIQREVFIADLKRILKNYGYRLEPWQLSSWLEDFPDISVDKSSSEAWYSSAMDAGTKLRSNLGPDCLVRSALLAISKWRKDRPEEDEPVAHLFWSLKHPEEVATLRLIYGSGFHLIALYAPEMERLKLLTANAGVSEKFAREHIARDSDEAETYGQKTRDAFQLADVFIPWGKRPGSDRLERFVKLIFGCPTVHPTNDEHRMFLAFASALRSAELSRQVGATLVSAEGDVIAQGANDVPKPDGGLYGPGPTDARDWKLGYDTNSKERAILMSRVASELREKLKGVLEEIEVESLASALEETSLKNLTEYGRSVHAEMDALLTCSRVGQTARGGTMYVTTFPCHNCARHLIATGVSRVVFIEPYPKSRALDLHDDAIEEVAPGAEPCGKVRFEPHLGVGPRRFFDYFSMNLSNGYRMERKDSSGQLVDWTPSKAAPRLQSAVNSIKFNEDAAVYELLPIISENKPSSSENEG